MIVQQYYRIVCRFLSVGANGCSPKRADKETRAAVSQIEDPDPVQKRSQDDGHSIFTSL
ncbi:hypothetical protein PHOSAC3_150403 [Mesotoga infera]|nr:hypothetical protein PHOSAC3_150403 [Mesotoga infera]